MYTKPVPVEPKKIACKVCLEEIPNSVANSQEGNEYAQHFCGIECYSIWKTKKREAETDSAREVD